MKLKALFVATALFFVQSAAFAGPQEDFNAALTAHKAINEPSRVKLAVEHAGHDASGLYVSFGDKIWEPNMEADFEGGPLHSTTHAGNRYFASTSKVACRVDIKFNGEDTAFCLNR